MTESDDSPLVSLGVFLYNEGRFVQESLESLLAQDYANIEIVISDNCSTDNTAEICQRTTGGDRRVKFERQEKNIGVAANSINVVQRSKGKYFMWASGHDLWSPDLVSKCVAALEERPDASLAYASSSWIDADGQHLDKESGWYDTRNMDAIERFFAAFWGNLHPVLGLIRTDYLKSIPKLHACAGSDQIILAELALRGDFLHIPGTAWWRREPRGTEDHKTRVKRYKSKEFGLAGSWLDRRLPLARLPLELIRALFRSQLTVIEKLVTFMALLPAFIARYVAGRKS